MNQIGMLCESSHISTSLSISVRSSRQDRPEVHRLPLETPASARATTRKDLDSVLHRYLVEREKFVNHLEKRHKRFIKRSKEDYDAARWGKFKSKPAKKPDQPEKEVSIVPISAKKLSMIASTSARAVSRAVAPAVNAVKPVRSRAFSRTAAVLTGNKKDDVTLSLDLAEATRVLRALEVEKSNSAYSMSIYLAKPKKGSRTNTLRGRVVLPFDSRKSSDVLLVFAERNSQSARLAREAGVAYVGADELFDPLRNGEINPTKVLTTPGMLGPVTAALGRFLGPKGMMPTVKRGGVGEGEELVAKINEARGAMDWSSNDAGVIRTSVGRVNFPLTSVEANCRALMDAVRSSMQTSTSGNVDENLISRRQLKTKQSSGIEDVFLQTSNGPRISIREI